MREEIGSMKAFSKLPVESIKELLDTAYKEPALTIVILLSIVAMGCISVALFCLCILWKTSFG